MLKTCYSNIGISSLLFFVSLPGLLGCGKLSNEVSATFTKPSVQDFARSQVINNGPGIADGQSELLVVIQLMNSDGTPVKLFQPTYSIISGAGVAAQACTTSNINGVSTCVLKASQAGVKRLSITNITISLEADVIFNQPGRKPVMGLISASNSQTQAGVKIQASLGNQEPVPVQTSGPVKLFGGVQGEAFSR